jgi:hypothetical protein
MESFSTSFAKLVLYIVFQMLILLLYATLVVDLPDASDNVFVMSNWNLRWSLSSYCNSLLVPYKNVVIQKTKNSIIDAKTSQISIGLYKNMQMILIIFILYVGALNSFYWSTLKNYTHPSLIKFGYCMKHMYLALYV